MFGIEEKLVQAGFAKMVENENGFIYVKSIGIGVVLRVEGYIEIYDKQFKLKVYDPTLPDYTGRHYTVCGLSEKELKLFISKMKDWRKKYEFIG